MSQNRLIKFIVMLVLGAGLALGLQNGTPVAAAAGKTFMVTSTADEPDKLAGDGKCASMPSNECTLRAAVMEANALGGSFAILLSPNNTYFLTRSGKDDTAFNGDLDVKNAVNLTVIGGDTFSTILDANQLDRLFEVTDNAHLTLKYLTLQHGKASGSGGAVFSQNAPVTLDHVLVQYNQAGGYAGGVGASTGGLTVYNSLFQENKVTTDLASAGAVANLAGSPSFFVNTTFLKNHSGDGGGLYNKGTATVVNSTFSQNSARSYGAGIYNDLSQLPNESLTLANVTIMENYADFDKDDFGDTGGLYSAGGKVNLRNTLIAYNYDYSPGQSNLSKPYDCKGALTSQGNNLIRLNSNCGLTNNVKGDLIGAVLAPQEPNVIAFALEGLRGYYGLQSSSPAINAGNANGCTDQNNNVLQFDQLYRLRPANGCDIGAFEYNAGCAVPVKPELFTPINASATKQTHVTLRWQDNETCTGTFKIIVKRDSKSGPTADSASNMTGQSYSTQALPQGHTYYWRVTFCAAGSTCSKSIWRKFTIKP